MTGPSSPTREKFVTAALELFLEGGVDGPSVQEICAKAGFGRTTFYEHFEHREALVGAVMERLIGNVTATALAGSAAGDLRSIVQNFIAAMFGGDAIIAGTEQWRFHDTLQICAKNPTIKAHYLRHLGDVKQGLKAQVVLGQRDGRIRRDVDADALVGLLVGLAYGAIALLELGADMDYAATADALIGVVSG